MNIGIYLQNVKSLLQAILTNKDAIAINQDTLGGDTTRGIIQGRRISSQDSLETWVKLLKGKTGSEYAVLFFNRRASRTGSWSIFTAQIASIGGDLTNGKTYKVRDIWGAKNLDDWTAGGTYTTPAAVPSKDCFMIRLSIPPVSTIPPLASVKVSSMRVQTEGERVLVQSKRSGFMTIRLVNLTGETVYSQHQAGPMDCSISTKGLPRGLYIVNVQNAMERFEQKVFLKQKEDPSGPYA